MPVLYKRDVIIRMLVKQECNMNVSVYNNKEEMKTRLPVSFSYRLDKEILRTKFLKGGENCNIPDLETLGSLHECTDHEYSSSFHMQHSEQNPSCMYLQ